MPNQSFRFIKIESPPKGANYKLDQFLSAIPLQASRPTSLTVAEGYALVLATLED